MSATSYGWLDARVPARGHARHRARLARAARPRCRAGSPRAAILLAVPRRRSARCSTCSTAPRTRASSSTRRGPTRPPATSTSDLAILVDPLSVFMCLVVSGVSFLIHLYSVAYMGGDRGYARYFAYLNFFVFSMLLLVLAANFVMLIVGWAFVGAASYLLISFWYRRETAVAAGIKAFVINVIGDVGLVIAAFLILDNDRLARLPAGLRRARTTPSRTNDGTLVGRLPAAAGGRVREVGPAAAPHLAPGRDGGPHPGLRADPRGDDGHRRRLPDRAHAPAVRAGADRRRRRRDHRHARRCVFAGTVALVGDRPEARDRLLARSRRSATWCMGVSIAAYSAGLFHLMTHAFFKALLFMGAGSVIGAMARHPGHGPHGRLPQARCRSRSSRSRSARWRWPASRSPPGCFSKDEILAFAINRGGWYAVLGVLGYVGALPHRLLRVPDGVPRLLRRRRCRRRVELERRPRWPTASRRTR